MANTELDKTIEELEAEVLAELEEANGVDGPLQEIVPVEKGETVSDGETKTEKVQDKGSGDASVKASKAGKEVSGDAAQKGEGKPDPMPKLKEEDEKDDDEEDKSDDSDDDEEEMAEMDHGKMKDEMLKAMKTMKKDEMANMYAQYMKASMHKTKDEMYGEMKNGMENMHKDKMEKLHAAYNAEMGHPDAEDEKKNEQVEARLKSLDVKEHVEALLSGDNNLSEDFKVKAATIFETVR